LRPLCGFSLSAYVLFTQQFSLILALWFTMVYSFRMTAHVLSNTIIWHLGIFSDHFYYFPALFSTNQYLQSLRMEEHIKRGTDNEKVILRMNRIILINHQLNDGFFE